MAEAAYQIDFMNPSLHTVEVRGTSSIDVDGVRMPADAMQFSIFDNEMVWIGPAYFVTNDVEFGSIADMRKRYPDAMLHEPSVEFDRSVPYGLVTWYNPPGTQLLDSMLVPVIDGVSAIYDRGRRKVTRPDGE